MKHRLGAFVVGGSVLALATLGVPAAGIAGAHTLDLPSAPAHTFTLTPSGTNVTVVGTTQWTPTGGAGPDGTQAPAATTYKLTKAAIQAATPRIPDVGLTPHTPYGVAPGTPLGSDNAAGAGSSGDPLSLEPAAPPATGHHQAVSLG